MGTGSGSASRACPASSKCAAHEREQQLGVCERIHAAAAECRVRECDGRACGSRSCSTPLHHRRVCVRRADGGGGAIVPAVCTLKCVKYCSEECQRTHWRTHITKPVTTPHPLELTVYVPEVVVDGVPCACNSCESARAGVMIAHPAGYVIRSGLETYVGPPCACQSCCRSREDVVAGRL